MKWHKLSWAYKSLVQIQRCLSIVTTFVLCPLGDASDDTSSSSLIIRWYTLQWSFHKLWLWWEPGTQHCSIPVNIIGLVCLCKAYVWHRNTCTIISFESPCLFFTQFEVHCACTTSHQSTGVWTQPLISPIPPWPDSEINIIYLILPAPHDQTGRLMYSHLKLYVTFCTL